MDGGVYNRLGHASLEVMSSITTDPGTIIELNVDRFNVHTFMMCKYEYLAFVKRCCLIWLTRCALTVLV